MGTRRLRKIVTPHPTGPCGKVPLGSRKAALRARQSMIHRDRRRGDSYKTNVYFCHACTAWHIGREWRDKR